MRTSDLRLAAGLVIALGLVYNLNFRAINSRDTHVAQYVAFSIASEGRTDLAAFPALHETGIVKGSMTRRNGRVYSNYPIVPSTMAAPVFWIALRTPWLSQESPSQVAIEAVGKLAASGVTALACGVFFLVLRRRLAPSVSLAVAMAAGLSTPLWSSASQALWNHGPAAFWLAVGWLALGVPGGTADSRRGVDRRTGPSGSPARWLTAGAALTLAVACRPLLGPFALGALVPLLVRRAGWRPLTGLAAGALAIVILVGTYNVRVHGSPAGGTAQLESADVHLVVHDVPSAWSDDPLTGLAGVLISPSRGVLIFMPIVIVAVVGAWQIGRSRRRAEMWTFVYPTIAFVLVWSTYAVWWSGHSYGPRYAADLALPLAAMAAAAFESGRSMSHLARAATIAALVWSVSVQALGAFAYPAGDWNGTPTDVDRAHVRLWDWSDSQLRRTGTGLFSTDQGR